MITPSQILTPVLAALEAAWGPQSATPRDMLLRVRAWASGDNCYVRIAPEQGGGEL